MVRVKVVSLVSLAGFFWHTFSDIHKEICIVFFSSFFFFFFYPAASGPVSSAEFISLAGCFSLKFQLGLESAAQM